MNIEELRIIQKELEKIVPIFLTEFISYVPLEKRRYIKERINSGFGNLLISMESGIGAWCKNDKIYFAFQNRPMFKKLSKLPEYGQNKGMILVDPEDIVDNEKDYVDYMEYVIANGLTELDYCLDFLPHQIMHLVGSSGDVLGEGVTEYRTRQVCQKYGIRCAPIMHSKETKLIKMLEKYLGEMALNDASFLQDFSIIEAECVKIFGSEFKRIYEDLRISYRMYAIDRSPDPIVHYKKYREIDFSEIFDLIESKEKSSN